MKMYALFFLVVVGFSSLASASDLERVIHLAEKVDMTARMAYENVHCIYQINEVVSSKEPIKSEIEFWSHGGKYYRVDVKKMTQSENSHVSVRLIIRPEGYVLLKTGSGNNLAIKSYGSFDEGLNLLYGYSFFRAGETMGLGPRLSIVLKEIESKGSAWEIASYDTDDLVARLVLSLKDFLWHIEIDLQSGVISSVKVKQKTANKSVITCSREMADHNGLLKNSLSWRESTDGSTYTEKIKLIRFDTEKFPLGVFSLNAQGVNSQGNPWIRRLIILGICTVLLGVYLAYRRKQT